jgi:hypothetical protein
VSIGRNLTGLSLPFKRFFTDDHIRCSVIKDLKHFRFIERKVSLFLAQHERPELNEPFPVQFILSLKQTAISVTHHKQP